MEYNKDYLSKKFIPSIFFDKDGKIIIKEVQIYLENNNLSMSKINSDFQKISDLKDNDFWKRIIGIVNECYNAKINIDNYDLKKDEDFKKLLNEILKDKFDHIFQCDESKKIKNKNILNQFLEELAKDKEVIQIESQDKIKRLIVPSKSEYSINALPNEPKTLSAYPNILLKIENDRISFNNSIRRKINGFIKRIESKSGDDSQSILCDFEDDKFENLSIDIINLFTNLKEEGFFTKNIKFHSPLFYFNAGSKEVLDYERLIDSHFYLNSLLNFVNIKQIKFIFNKNINGKNKDFLVTLKSVIQELTEDAGILKFNVQISKNKYLTPSIEAEIKNKLASLGIKQDCAYELPIEHYLNKLIYNSTNLDKIYAKISKIDKEDTLLKELQTKKIITNDGTVRLDSDKLKKYISDSLKDIVDVHINSKPDKFVITQVSLDTKKRILLNIKIYNDELQNNEYYVAVISEDVRGYDRILKIILQNFDYAYVLKNIILKNADKVLDYIYRKTESYLLYEYELQLGKEARSAHSWLESYTSKLAELEKERKPSELGNIVEKKVNIVIKYIYRNYLTIGGPRKPDGYLYKDKTNCLLFDSKQHKNIHIGEIDKIARYLISYSKKEQLPHANTGVLIICREKLDKTLNKTAVDDWKKSQEFKDKFKIAFVSLEFIQKIYGLFNKPTVKSNPLLIKKIYDSTYEAISASSDFTTKAQLIKSEDKILEGIQKEIQREPYIPAEKQQL